MLASLNLGQTTVETGETKWLCSSKKNFDSSVYMMAKIKFTDTIHWLIEKNLTEKGQSRFYQRLGSFLYIINTIIFYIKYQRKIISTFMKNFQKKKIFIKKQKKKE